MKAQDIVDRIGRGVAEALATKSLLLGLEGGTYDNPELKPEYVTTVKVGEALIDASHVVRLEASMRRLRDATLAQTRMKLISHKDELAKLEAAFEPFKFGKKRLDVLVLSPDGFEPPILMAEAKLGVGNIAGVLRDIERVVTLFHMLDLAGLRSDTTYGAVVFHFMREDTADESGGIIRATTAGANLLLAGVAAQLALLAQAMPWLNTKAGLLTTASHSTTTSGHLELYDDGSVQGEFEKHGYTFVPGLILLGSAADVKTVQF